MKEQEQGLLEAQQKVIAARQSLNQISSLISTLEREKRRIEIAREELASLPESRGTYKAVGRMFVSVPATDLLKELDTKKAACDEEAGKLAERKAGSEKAAGEAETLFKKRYLAFQQQQEEIHSKKS
eukprot:RCo008991